MNEDRKFEQSLKDLNTDIVWKEERQQRIRKELIQQMQRKQSRKKPMFKRKIVHAFSIVLSLAIVAIILLTELGSHQVLDSTQAQLNGISQTDVRMKEMQVKNPSNHHEDNRLLTQREIMDATKGQMSSQIPLQLPKKIQIPEGKHLTAVTSSEQTGYEVIFYHHDEPIPINNQRLLGEDNPAEVIARVSVQRYDTQERADDAVAYEAFDEESGDAIALNEELTGYKKTTDSSTHMRWNVGRWAITTVGEHSLPAAVVDYLDMYMLPAPREHGYAHLSTHGDTHIVWQNETTVYTIDQVSDPFKALEIAVEFEQ